MYVTFIEGGGPWGGSAEVTAELQVLLQHHGITLKWEFSH